MKNHVAYQWHKTNGENYLILFDIPPKFQKYSNESVTVIKNHICEATEKLTRYLTNLTSRSRQWRKSGPHEVKRNRTIARIAGLTGHNIAITSITATRRIAVGWIRPFSARAQPEANQPATSACSIHLYIRVTQTSWSNWLSDLKGAAFKQVLLNKPLTRETTLENLPLSAVSSPFLSI